MDNNADERRQVMNNLRVELEVRSSSAWDSGSGREEDDGAHREASQQQQPVAGRSIGNDVNRRRLLSKQLSMKETSREAKWEKRRRQILRRSSMVSVTGAAEQLNGEGKGSPVIVDDEHQVMSSPSSARCLTDEDLDELRGSFELGFGFDEETGGANLRDTLPALDLYFAVNAVRRVRRHPRCPTRRHPKLKTIAAASPTSTLSAVSSSSTLPDTPSPRSPNAGSPADAWKIFSPGEINPFPI
jgi:hypothetical protein